IDSMPSLTSFQPSKPRRTTDSKKPRIPLFELSLELCLIQIPGRGQSDRFHSPTDHLRCQRFFFGGFPSPAHAFGEPFGKYPTVCVGTVIVFAGADIAARAVEMYV